MTRRILTIISLAVALLPCGCGASRHTLKSDIQEKTETAGNTGSSSEENTNEGTSANTRVSQNEEVITEVTEFDTTQPENPETGTPPVKRKVVRTKRTGIKVQQEAATERQSTANRVENREYSEKTDNTAVVEETGNRGLNRAQSALCLCGIFAILAWVVRGFTKRFKL